MNTKVDVAEERVLGELSKVRDPDLGKDIVSLGFVRNLKIEGGSVSFDINLTTPACPVKDQMRDEAEALVGALDGVTSAKANMTAEVRQAPRMDKSTIAGVKNIVAVVLDGDIYGPTMPIMLGVTGPPDHVGNRITPRESSGLKFMSMGLMVKTPDQPLIWRGPMAHKAFQQCLFEVNWGELDYLIVDLPPGTGDVHLTLAQSVPITGCVIVSTPQDVGLQISMKTLRMFEQTKVPILGIIENMAYYVCPHCDSKDHIFGDGGARRAAGQLDIPFLGEVPLDLPIRTQADAGVPIVLAQPEAASSVVLREIAERLAAQISIQNYNAPVLEVE